MTITTAAPSVAPTQVMIAEEGNIQLLHQNGKQNGNGLTLLSTLPANRKKAENKRKPPPKPALPTFPLEVGYREGYDATTGKYTQRPLTLREVLYPQEEEIGIVIMTQGPIHDRWSRRLAETFAAYVADENWLVLHDVLINWGIPGVSSRSPDVTLIYGGEFPAEGNESYHVGRDGPLPDFVIEITSESTRFIDVDEKIIVYASVGIPEFLIIDKGTPFSEPWALRGYRLGTHPTYEEILPDAQGRITFARIGLQFEVIGRETIHVYDAVTGERWLIPEEQKRYADAETARANAETARANAETTARLAAEAQAEQERLARNAAETQAEQERLARNASDAKLAEALEQLRLLGAKI